MTVAGAYYPASPPPVPAMLCRLLRLARVSLAVLPLAIVLLTALAPSAAAQAECALGTAEARLRGLDVEAALFTNGNLFYGNQTTDGDGYLAPLGEDGPDGRPLSPLFAANFWVGATVGGEIRATAARYTNFALRPGRTGPDHVPPDSTACAEADRIWVVSRDDIAAYYAGAAPEADLAQWPVHLGAPVLDGDGIAGNYDLASGDQPAIRGDVMAFWAMTDLAAQPGYGPTVGLDVAAEAFVIRTTPFRDETFYRFTHHQPQRLAAGQRLRRPLRGLRPRNSQRRLRRHRHDGADDVRLQLSGERRVVRNGTSRVRHRSSQRPEQPFRWT